MINKNLKKIIILIIILIIQSNSLPGQNSGSIHTIATDSTKDEIDPYLTNYWYDGNFSYDFRILNSEFSPLWLTYVEVSPDYSSRIKANNIKFDKYHHFILSDEFTVSDTTRISELRHPIIENFLGKPVAIWIDTDSSRTDLFYSYLQDSVWVKPANVTLDFSIESLPVYITIDDFRLSNQTNSTNFLFWVIDSSINSRSLLSNYTWGDQETIHHGHHKIVNLKARYSLKNHLWVLIEEKIDTDSVSINAMILPKDSLNWKGPYELLRIKTDKTYANLCLYDFSDHNDALLLNWVENDFPKDTSVIFESDSIRFTEDFTRPYQINFPSLNIVTNNLLVNGVCMTIPSPYYLFSIFTDQEYELYISETRIWKDNLVYKSKNFIDPQSISGLYRNNFVCCWCEINNDQSNILCYSDYITIGSIKNDQSSPINVNILYQNRPNPFNASTTIEYYLHSPQNIIIELFDLLGKKIKTIYSGFQTQGYHRLRLDSDQLSTGIYYFRLNTNAGTQTIKGILIK